MSGAFSKALVQGERDGVVTKVINPEIMNKMPNNSNQPQQAASSQGYRSVSGRRASFVSRRRARLLGAGTDLES